MTPTLTLASVSPTSLSMRIEGQGTERQITLPDPHTSHVVPILGLREGIYTLSPSLIDEEGARRDLSPLELLIPPPPEDFPEITLRAALVDRVEPGLIWFGLTNVRDDLGFVVALDEEALPVYLLRIPADVFSPQLTPAGEVATVEREDIVFRAMQGDLLRRYAFDSDERPYITVPYEDFHHDLQVEPDGSFFALAYRHADVPEYPVSYDALETYAPATIRNDLLVHIAKDGAVLDELPMLDLLDPHRVGYDSLLPALSGALDWVHVNALRYDRDTDELTLSVRHQDAVVHLTLADRKIRWILGHPYGWPESLAEHLLVADPPFTWPIHQHGFELDADGRVRLFDNGNDLRSSPYYDSGELVLSSRALELQIDEERRTVSLLAERRLSSDGESLYSDALGSARRMPLTDNRLDAWGLRGRLVETDPAGEAVWDVSFESGPWRIDRAEHKSSLYPAGTSDIYISPAEGAR